MFTQSQTVFGQCFNLPETEYSPVQGFSNNFQLLNSVTHSVSVNISYDNF